MASTSAISSSSMTQPASSELGLALGALDEQGMLLVAQGRGSLEVLAADGLGLVLAHTGELAVDGDDLGDVALAVDAHA
jgi:hypothetical protein